MFVSTILIIIFFTWLFVRWNSSRRIIFYDYSNKPKDQVIYYEILSDIISQMRLRIGNKALEIAKTIPELKINDKNGLVLNIKDDPAKIVALLVSKYEKLSGRRVSFALRPK
jgi:hypothetical protein